MSPVVDADLLVVEDNASDLELAVRALKKTNLSSPMLVLRDGSEVLDYLFATGRFAGRSLEKTPRLILLDLKLPKVDGIEVLRRIKSDERTKSIPVVILTSSQVDRDIVESYRLGVNSYIVKPVDYAKFSQSIAEVSLYWLTLNQPPR